MNQIVDIEVRHCITQSSKFKVWGLSSKSDDTDVIESYMIENIYMET